MTEAHFKLVVLRTLKLLVRAVTGSNTSITTGEWAQAGRDLSAAIEDVKAHLEGK